MVVFLHFIQRDIKWPKYIGQEPSLLGILHRMLWLLITACGCFHHSNGKFSLPWSKWLIQHGDRWVDMGLMSLSRPISHMGGTLGEENFRDGDTKRKTLILGVPNMSSAPLRHKWDPDVATCLRRGESSNWECNQGQKGHWGRQRSAVLKLFKSAAWLCPWKDSQNYLNLMCRCVTSK